MRCRTSHAAGCGRGNVHPAAVMAARRAGGYDGLYSVQYDGAAEVATNSAADAEAPHNYASGTIALWVKTTDTAATFLNWTDAGSNNRVVVYISMDNARVFVEMNGATQSNAPSTTNVNDGAWHLIGFTWTWSTGIQIYFDGVAEGALDATADLWPASPAMNTLEISSSDYAGQIARVGQWGESKDAAWWASAYVAPRQVWGDSVNEWRMGDTGSDRATLATITDVGGGLDLATTAMGPANLVMDHP